jgi:multiple sugar transport system ATP-binding protein
MARVTLASVTKDYPTGVRAVDRISLAIEDHEFVVLVGPSGCGKSTTLRLIAGLEEPSSGTVSIDDRVVNHTPPKQRDVAMVFQNYALYPHMTVYKNMAFSLILRRRELGLAKADIDRKVREAASALGISDLLERKPQALSGGQRQRVAVGRAIVRDPSVFLFDEPLSNLDARLRVELRSEIKRIQRRLRTTTVYVTHDQEEAMSLGDRVVVMRDGVVQQCAAALDVYERPANRFVAAFIGTPPMSFLDGRVVKHNGGMDFDMGSVRLPLPSRFVNRLSGYPGRRMVLGLRPDAFSPEPLAEASGEAGGFQGLCPARLDVRIALVEPLGDRKDIYMTASGQHQLVGRVDGRAAVFEGQELQMFIDMNRVHLFEPGEMGVNVTAASNGERASAN